MRFGSITTHRRPTIWDDDEYKTTFFDIYRGCEKAADPGLFFLPTKEDCLRPPK
jgi:hypothetical protein